MTFKIQLVPQSRCFLTAVLFLTLCACNAGENQTSIPEAKAAGLLSSDVLIDGSGVVFPMSQLMAQEFMEDYPEVNVAVGLSNTTQGLQSFCSGEIDISTASRPIKKSEIELCEKNKIEFVEIPIAFGGISVTVNRANNWATCLTPKELGKIWERAPEGKIVNWKQVRNGYPDKPLALYGLDKESGTYSYFIQATVGEGEGRNDYTSNQEQDVLVEGVRSDERSLGFFAISYYLKNKDTLNLVAIENAQGKCVKPSQETVKSGTYNPLTRPLLLYINKVSLQKRSAVKAFVNYYIAPANNYLILKSGYVTLPENILLKVQTRVDNATIGTIFKNESSIGVKLVDIL
ncbi:MAG: PstS family phosphate ABC transporter substrate-binding protein [Scytonema sp. PMC 1069.18]|nr:PstS family phosphate ABC transporter substrate-binding protein [Scytonema sp. PMC 1069.18]MEC4881406.1 PstS family phosphate ABC transporter substrate-binding protein [Scytonema sp. PMC 1070.18]